MNSIRKTNVVFYRPQERAYGYKGTGKRKKELPVSDKKKKKKKTPFAYGFAQPDEQHGFRRLFHLDPRLELEEAHDDDDEDEQDIPKD